MEDNVKEKQKPSLQLAKLDRNLGGCLLGVGGALGKSSPWITPQLSRRFAEVMNACIDSLCQDVLFRD